MSPANKNLEGVYPLSPAQQGMLFHSLYEPASGAYVTQVVLRCAIDDMPAFERAWDLTLQRHAVLRSAMLWENLDRPLQAVGRRVQLPIEHADWRELGEEQRAEALRVLLAADRERGFKLSKAPLMRLATQRLDAREYQVLWTFHHILLDGWSLPLILSELSAAYEGLVRGEEVRLPPVRPYAEFIAWLQAQDLASAEVHWRRTLAGFTGATDLGMAVTPPQSSGGQASARLQLTPAETAKIQALAHDHRITLSTIAQAAWGLLLARYSGEDDVVFGTTVSGRPAAIAGVESMVGLFINVLPTRIGTQAHEAVLPWLHAVQRQQVQLAEFQYTPLVQVQRWSDVPHAQPLFETVVAFENYPVARSAPGAAASLNLRITQAREKTNYPLTLIVTPGAQLTLSVLYDSGRVDAVRTTRMVEDLRILILGIAEHIDGHLGDIPILTPAERHRTLTAWNQTARAYPAQALLHELVEQQVDRTPDAVAIRFQAEALSYRELDALANRLARRLQAAGLGPDGLVGVCMERSIEMVVALLAVLKAGGAYVPLEPDLPRERLGVMIADSACAIVLTQQRFVDRLPADGAIVISVDGDAASSDAYPAARLAARSAPDNLAYVIYTSGSTGVPKGAMNTHRAICNRLLWMQDEYGLTTHDRVLQKTPFSFDVSVWELFWPLLSGAQLVMARPGGHQDPLYLAATIRDAAVTTLHFVPSMLQAFLDQDSAALARCASLRRVICSGEALPAAVVHRFFERLPGALHNLYGPTEAAVDVTFFPCSRAVPASSVPIGRPVANTRMHVLDARCEPVPPGVVGELYIAGVQVGRGYLARPGLTADRFVPDPFAAAPGARMYRTGDAGRYLETGDIEFIGRLDHQVKIRGNRVELGEIENALVQHPGIREGAALVREDAPGDQRLVAYVVPGHHDAPSAADLRRHLRTTLPDYMVPSIFVFLGELPHLSNGKVNRRALPSPELDRPDLNQAFEAPRTTAEERLAEIWAAALRVSRVGVHDNFFELGGDSILSLQIVSRANQAGIRIAPRDVFEHPTIAELVAVAAQAAQPSIDQGPVSGAVPLTPIQQRFFAHDLADRHHYNQAVALVVRQPIDESLLRSALGHLTAHHDALRLSFRRTAAGWAQAIAPEQAGAFPLERIDLSRLPSGEQQTRMAREADRIQASLDLADGPVARAALFALGPRQPARLLLVAHHLVVDTVSWRILIEALETVCAQLVAGRPAELPSKTSSFKEWSERLAEYSGSAALLAERDYWADAGRAGHVPLPVDHPEARSANTSGSTYSVMRSLTARETKALLQHVPKAYGADVNDVLLTALAEVLGDWCGSRSVFVELEGHGREPIFPDVDLSRTVGWFTTAYPVRLDLSGVQEQTDALRAIKEQLRRVPRKGLGYGVLRYLSAEAIAAPLAELATPEVSFNYLGRFNDAPPATGVFGLAAGPTGVASDPRNARAHLLEINSLVAGGRLQIEWRYCAQLHDAATVEGLAERFAAAVRRIVALCAAQRGRVFTPSDFPLARVTQRELDALQTTHGPRGLEDLYVSSPMQQGMLYHTLASPSSSVFVTQITFLLRGRLNRPAFRQAWQLVVDRHGVLRSAFTTGHEAVHVVVSRKVRVPWREYDLRGSSEDAQAVRLQQLLEEDRRQGFDLARPPLMRCAVLRLDQETSQLVWTLHHSIVDGWSLPLILGDVLTAYEAMCEGREPRFEPRRSFRDYIAWLEGRDAAAAEGFWRESLRGFTAPTPLPASTRVDSIGESEEYGSLSVRVAGEQSAEMLRFARQHGLTLNTVVQGAWAALLARYSGHDDVVYGTTVAGRPPELPGVEAMIGVFINTLPMRVRVEGAVAPWLRRLQATQVAMREFEHTPLVDVQRWSDIGARVPLFETLFVFENYPAPASNGAAGDSALRISGLRGVERANYPLTLISRPGAEIALQMSFDRRLFDDEAIGRLLEQLTVLLSEMVARPDAQVATLPVLSRAAAARMLGEWNETPAAAGEAVVVTRQVEAAAARYPGAVAVAGAGEHLSYAQLNRRANQLARVLQSHGVVRGSVVAVLLDRSCEMVVAILAALKAGAAYLPIDPGAPADRIAMMIADAGAQVVVTRTALAGAIESSTNIAGRLALVCVDDDRLAAALDDGNLPAETTADDLAYIIYTSGSTGRPKGVAVSHRGLTNLVRWHQRAFGVGPADRATQFASHGFDAAVWEIWPYLAAGASVHLPDGDTRLDAVRLRDWIVEQGITVSFIPTELTEQLMALNWPAGSALRYLLTGADTLRRYPPEGLPFRVVNNYGPTECSVVATSGVLPAGVPLTRLPSIGTPIDGAAIYILDRHLNPVPIGAAGELHIGGAGVARGYHGRPDLTAEKFIPDPFGREAGARLYRTGDLARFAPDGQIEFVGRSDQQVKIRGFRIEPGEIEVALRSHPAVAEAIAIARSEDGGAARLIAYVMPRGDVWSVSELIDGLKRTLPPYMVPEAFVRVDAFPLTPNGKIDVRALPDPGDARPALASAFVSPRSPLEEMLAAIWCDLLGLAQVGVRDNFFDLGGHSLLATRLVSRVRDAFGVEVALRDLFETQTVAALSERITAYRGGAPADAMSIVPVAREGDLPLSPSQRRLWFLTRFGTEQVHYHVVTALRLTGRLDLDAFGRALREIVRRHESLRTTFPSQGGEPVQRIGTDEDLFQLKVVDLEALAPDARERAAAQTIAEERQRPFDIETGPLFRATVIVLGSAEQIFAVSMHHIVADAWSLGVFWDELAQLYRAFTAGQPSPLAALPVQYADYACWQQARMARGSFESEVGYWRTRLADSETLQLRTDRPRPPVQTFNGATVATMVPKALADRLKAMSREHGITPYMLLLAGFKALLHRYSDQDDIVVGTPTAGRNRSEIESLIGFFINTLVLRTDLSNNPSFVELFGRVKQTALDAYAHQDVPFDRLVEELRPERDLSRNPLFQVAFALQNAPSEPLEIPGVTVRAEAQSSDTTRFDIELHLVDRADGLAAVCCYNTELFDRQTIERMLEHYRVLLEAMAVNPRRLIDDVPLVGDDERRALVAAASAADAQAVPATPVVRRFAARAERTPDAVAVTCGPESCTYAQLNARANQLAHHLIALGVGSNVLVGLYMDRSLDLIVAILGILKAGGAYVPLDPAYPAERLAFMLEDARAPIVVTTSRLGASLPSGPSRLVQLDVAREQLASLSVEDPCGDVPPASVAYVIYTSGSTGRPKGVAVTHANLSRLLTETECWFDFGADDVWTLFHSYAFDFSVWEIWGALAYGGRLVVVPYEVSRSPLAFHELLRRERVTVLNQTPSAFRQLIEADNLAAGGAALALRWVVFGGEALDPQTLEPWFARHGDAAPRLVNMYGITETTVHVTYRPLVRHDAASARSVIGRPIPDLQVYVLDRRGQLAPIGVGGELYVGGAGVAQGYLNRPGLTAERFVPDAISGVPGARLYRTGDLARRTADGDIEYLGRIDHQVKVRGFRIELGEIETVLLAHPAVRDAVVMRREDREGDARLVAYVVPDAHAASQVVEAVRLEREGLPDGVHPYELPNGLVVFHRNKNETDFLYREIFGDLSYLRHGISLAPDACVFDVGANTGLFTVFVETMCPEAQVYAFEPIPPVCAVARLNARVHGGRAHVFDCGLSNEPSTAEFTYYPQMSIMSGRFADTAAERNTIKAFIGSQQEGTDVLLAGSMDDVLTERLTAERVTCRLRTISEVIQEHGIERIDLLKVDVEKSELQVLGGVSEKDWPKIQQIVIEVHDLDGRLEAVERLLDSRGFAFIVEQDETLAGTALYNIYGRRRGLRPAAPVASAAAPVGWQSARQLIDDLRATAKISLPEYMVPSAVVVIDELPLTANGKLNRQALPAPEQAGRSDAALVAPTDDIEIAVSEVWQEVLGLDRLGTTQNFFDLGGHSLLLAKVHTKLRERLGVQFSIVELFRHPTIQSLAAYFQSLDGTGGDRSARPPDDRENRLQAGTDRLRQLRQRRDLVEL